MSVCELLYIHPEHHVRTVYRFPDGAGHVPRAFVIAVEDDPQHPVDHFIIIIYSQIDIDLAILNKLPLKEVAVMGKDMVRLPVLTDESHDERDVIIYGLTYRYQLSVVSYVFSTLSAESSTAIEHLIHSYLCYLQTSNH